MITRYIQHKAFPFLLTFGFILLAQACLALEPDATILPQTISSDLRETTSLVTAISKVIGSLAVVVGLMLLIFFLFKKFGFNKGLAQGGSLINVIESRMIAPKKYIAVVEIAEKCVAVGITDNSITMLTDIDNTSEGLSSTPTPKEESRSFPGLLKKAAHSIQNKSKSAKSTQEREEADNAQ